MHPQKPAAVPEEMTLPGTPLQVDPPSVSEHFALPATRFKPFPPVTKLAMDPQKPVPAPEEVTLPGAPLQVDPPKPLVVPPHPTPAPDELRLHNSCSLTEDEENEYVQYIGKTIRVCDLLKSERLRLLEAEVNSRMPAWVESDSEVLEEVWASEVVEVLGFEEEKLDEASEKGDGNDPKLKHLLINKHNRYYCSSV
ncbi:Solute carrier organic anion transporter family member 4C1 [Labeo rohita]|uniref:Solute carrier organic anion transporter family member 4C1 n=1 Tax=Labeo rohita TaxID=84645 RepID=A0ABQ8L5A0_LABRO|nr:Solute carrier organic anion transporter family member 4C1 [Labeo rohita]